MGTQNGKVSCDFFPYKESSEVIKMLLLHAHFYFITFIVCLVYSTLQQIIAHKCERKVARFEIPERIQFMTFTC